MIVVCKGCGGPVRADSYYGYCTKVRYCRLEARRLGKERNKVPLPRCKGCEGEIRTDNKTGYCRKTLDCKYNYYRVKNAQVHNVAQRKAWHDRNWDAQMWAAAKARAQTKGIEFTITRADIRAILTQTCPVFGEPLVRSAGKRPHAHGPWSPSLDRIDNSKGYVPGNIQILSVKANAMKGDATPDELLRFAVWVQANYG